MNKKLKRFTESEECVMRPDRIMKFNPRGNMKIKVLLKVLDKHNLIFQVLWMDERFRGSDAFYEVEGDINIYSSRHAAIQSGIESICSIYLQGSATEQDDRACVTYVKDAYVEKERIIVALKDWAENWDGFKDDCSDEKDSADDIYCI